MASISIVHRVSIPSPQTHLVHVETTHLGLRRERPRAPGVARALHARLDPGLVPGPRVRAARRGPRRRAARARARRSARTPGASTPREPLGSSCATACTPDELTVRTNHVDETHAFLVGAALFLGVEGRSSWAPGSRSSPRAGWRAATSLPPSPARGVGDEVLRFEAPDFDTLVDSPIELGTHREERFEAVGKPHRYAIWPARLVGDADVRRLVDDTRTIVETEARALRRVAALRRLRPLAAPLAARTRRPRAQRERGAHRVARAASRPATRTSISCRSSRTRRSTRGTSSASAPPGSRRTATSRSATRACSGGSRARRATTTGASWPCRALCTIDEYLDHLAAEIAYLDQTPGRLVHALEDASYDAWIKLYRPDENSTNSSVSYYRKGEVVCALLDLEIRARSGGRASLDAVLARLWEEYGAPGPRRCRRTRCRAIFERVAGAPHGRPLRRLDSLALGDRLRAHARARRPRARAHRSGPRRRPVRWACACEPTAGARMRRRWRASRGPGGRGSTRATRSSRSAARGSRERTSRPRSAAARRATPSRSSWRATAACTRRR